VGARPCEAWLRHDERASFLTQDEKRAAVGYGPAPREELPQLSAWLAPARPEWV
jgi:hypothetical protein